MKKFNTCIVLAFAILLAACSSLRLAYNNADTLLYWWLDAYVDFDSAQKSEVKNDIDAFFRWHRKTQLQEEMNVGGLPEPETTTFEKVDV